jgi:hypothetical protein
MKMWLTFDDKTISQMDRAFSHHSAGSSKESMFQSNDACLSDSVEIQLESLDLSFQQPCEESSASPLPFLNIQPLCEAIKLQNKTLTYLCL